MHLILSWSKDEAVDLPLFQTFNEFGVGSVVHQRSAIVRIGELQFQEPAIARGGAIDQRGIPIQPSSRVVVS